MRVDQDMIDEVYRNYPPGTIYIPLRDYTVDEHEENLVTESSQIRTNGMDMWHYSQPGYIYNNGKWAEIISSKSTKELNFSIF